MKYSYNLSTALLSAATCVGMLATNIAKANDLDWNLINQEQQKLMKEADQLEYDLLPDRKERHEADRHAFIEAHGGNPNSEELKRWMTARHYKIMKADQKLKTKVPSPEYDLSTIGKGSTVITWDQVCKTNYKADVVTPSGDKIKMLGYAFVWNNAGGGASLFGHGMQRFDYCRNGQYFKWVITDGPTDEKGVRYESLKQYGFSEKQVNDYPTKNQGNYLYTWLVADIDGYYKGRQLDEQRSVFEAYFNLSGDKMYKAFMLNMKRFSDQAKRVLKAEPLTAYQPFSNNCLDTFKDTIEQVVPNYLDAGASVLPRELFMYVHSRQVYRVVVYPELSLMKKKNLKISEINFQ